MKLVSFVSIILSYTDKFQYLDIILHKQRRDKFVFPLKASYILIKGIVIEIQTFFS